MEKKSNELNTIDLSKDGVYYVKDGKVNTVDDLPYGFGTQTITWQNGQVVRTELSYSKKV